MTRWEWIAHFRNQIGMLEEDARAQRRLAEYQKSDADQHRKTLEYAEMLERWAEQSRHQLKHFEHPEGK